MSYPPQWPPRCELPSPWELIQAGFWLATGFIVAPILVGLALVAIAYLAGLAISNQYIWAAANSESLESCAPRPGASRSSGEAQCWLAARPLNGDVPVTIAIWPF